MTQPDLHDVPALKRVPVRDGVMLRPLAARDAKSILQILEDDPEIRKRVWVAAAMHTAQDVEEQVEKGKNDATLLRYVIEEDGKVAGMVTFWRAGDYFGDKAEENDYGFGYFLAPSARGRGLVTDSLTALMSIALETLEVHSFIAFCEADNAASGSLLKKAGLKPTKQTWTEPDNGWVEQKYQRNI